MLLAHLVLNTTLNIDFKSLSMLIKDAKKPKFFGLSKILPQMVLSFEELMQLCESFVLLHCADFDPIGEIMNSRLVLTYSPDFSFENFDRDLSPCFFQVSLNDLFIKLLHMLVLYIIVLISRTIRFY